MAGLAAGIHAVADGIDAASQNFTAATLGGAVARYRVQGVKSTQCENARITTQAVGLLAVQIRFVTTTHVGTPLSGAGTFTGKITWDPAGAVPEGGIR